MIDKDSIIRKSLQSDSYYKRHRQKARKDVRGPSTEHSQGSTKNIKQKRGLPPFQHIPLSFMNSLTPKGRARFREDSIKLVPTNGSNRKRKRTSSRTHAKSKVSYHEYNDDEECDNKFKQYFKDLNQSTS